jgi:HK97 family phage portal protein
MLGRLFARRSHDGDTEARSAPFVVHGPGVWGIAGLGAAGGSLGALRSAAVWACMDVLASSVGELPFGAVRESGGTRLPVNPTPSLIDAPSGLVTVDVWLYQLVWSMLDDGNAFGLITATDQAARPTFIETLDPGIVTERKVVGGVAQAKVDGEIQRVYPYGDLFHVPGKMVPPGTPFGLSPRKHAQNAIDAGLSAEAFGRSFFDGGGVPTSVIYSDEELTRDQAAAVKASWKQATAGSREPAVLGAGLKHEVVEGDKAGGQFIDLQRFVTEQVCRFFRVPPSMVYASVSGQNVTYANVTQADLHFLKHSLDGYLVRIERAVSALLPRPQFARFNRNALLRADAESRWKVHQLALATRTRTINEVRALEDEQPFAGDEFNQPGIPPIAGASAPAPTTEATP